MNVETLTAELAGIGIDVVPSEFTKTGVHADVTLDASKVRPFAEALLKAGFYLNWLTAVDVNPEIRVVYQFGHHESRIRVKARVAVSEEKTAPTISDIYHGASWYEREVRDFFAVTFDGSDDMRPLILSEMDADLAPLLKADKKRKDAVDLGLARPEAAAEPDVAKTPPEPEPEQTDS